MLRGERRHCGTRDTYTAVVSEEDGVALDVPVDHALRVQDRQRLQDGETHSGDLLFVHPEGAKKKTPAVHPFRRRRCLRSARSLKSNSDCIRFRLT